MLVPVFLIPDLGVIYPGVLLPEVVLLYVFLFFDIIVLASSSSIS